MSAKYLEIPAKFSQKESLSSDLLAITDINQEFLKLVLHPEARRADGVLGLDAAIIEALNNLTIEQHNTIAAVPLLLAHIIMPPAHGGFGSVADHDFPHAHASKSWRHELQGFVDRLLTCVWHAARRENGIAPLCMGIDTSTRLKLGQLSFRCLGDFSRSAAVSLRARLADHPSFWPDLISSVVSGDPKRQIVSQLSVIQLSVMDGPAHAGERGRGMAHSVLR